MEVDLGVLLPGDARALAAASIDILLSTRHDFSERVGSQLVVDAVVSLSRCEHDVMTSLEPRDPVEPRNKLGPVHRSPMAGEASVANG
jgi:hypothetical protein